MARVLQIATALAAFLLVGCADARLLLQVASCDRGGDADILGLGVRLGVYLTGVALVLATHTHESIKDLEAVIAAAIPLLFALEAVLTHQVVVDTVSDFAFLTSTYLVQVYLVAMFLPLLCYIKAVLLLLYEDKIVLPGLIVAMACMLNVWVAALQLWFWASGYATLHNSACGVTWTFVVVRLDADGWVRTLALVAVAMNFAFYVILMLLSCIGATFGLMSTMRQRHDPAALAEIAKTEKDPVHVEEGSPLGLSNGVSLHQILVYCVHQVFGFWYILCALSAVIGCVIGAELSIYWNQMQGLYVITGSGQVLPLVTGIVTLSVNGGAAIRQICLSRWMRKAESEQRNGPV